MVIAVYDPNVRALCLEACAEADATQRDYEIWEHKWDTAKRRKAQLELEQRRVLEWLKRDVVSNTVEVEWQGLLREEIEGLRSWVVEYVQEQLESFADIIGSEDGAADQRIEEFTGLILRAFENRFGELHSTLQKRFEGRRQLALMPPDGR